ncbi:MAG: choice-of-anchor D domain-containing protein, partial [bacterium]
MKFSGIRFNLLSLKFGFFCRINFLTSIFLGLFVYGYYFRAVLAQESVQSGNLEKIPYLAQYQMQISGEAGEVEPPLNDECETAIIVNSLPFKDLQNTRNATYNPADPKLSCSDDGNQTYGNTVWYTFTAMDNINVNISTNGSNYDTFIEVFNGDCANLTEIDCADIGFTDNLVFDAIAGETYFIKIGEYQGGTGGGELLFSMRVDSLFQGPETGSIASGAFVSTDNFSSITAKNKGLKERKDHLQRVVPLRDIVIRNDLKKPLVEPTGPVGSNFVEDLDSLLFEINAPRFEKGFPGIPDDANSAGLVFIPPDPIIAAGPNHLVACINTDFAIFDKIGNKLFEVDATEWFENVLPGLDPANQEPFSAVFDPQIVYDHFADRWVMIYIATDLVGQSFLLLSTSDDDNPLGTWCNWALPGNQNGSTPNTNINDFPKLGFDNQAIYVTTNQFDLVTSSFQYVQVRIIGKAQLYQNTCGPVTWTDFWDLRNPSNLFLPTFTTVPAVTFGTPGVEYLVDVDFINFSSGTFMNLWSLTDPLGSPTLSAVTVSVTAFNSPPDADQFGGSTIPIDVGGRRNRNVVYKNGSVWTAHSVGDVSGQFARARYVRIDVSSAMAIEDFAFGKDNFWYFYPAVMVDKSGNLFMAFTRSGFTEFASARYTGRLTTDPAGLQASALLKAGEANYVKTFDDPRNRWGDYNGIALDPVDNSKVWMFIEYAASPANTWGTWIGSTSFIPLSGPQIEFKPETIDFGAVLVGESSFPVPVTIQNIGDQTLTVNNISLGNAMGPFTLSGLPALPTDIPSFGSIEFSAIFAPIVEEAAIDIITISSNDADDPSVTITIQGTTSANIDLSASTLEVSVESGQTTNEIFTIKNTGGVDLEFDISFTGVGTLNPSGLAAPVSHRVHQDVTLNRPFNNSKISNGLNTRKKVLLNPDAAGDKDYDFSAVDEPLAFEVERSALQYTAPNTIFQYDVSTPAGEALALGIEFESNFIWVSGAGSIDFINPNRLFKYDINGNLLATFDQGTTTFVGWTDLAFDGTFLYGIERDAQKIDQINPTTGMKTGFTIPSPVLLGRALAYDPAKDHFWVSGLRSHGVFYIYEIDRQGNVINQFSNPLEIRGLGWDDRIPGRPFLWIWSSDGNGTLATLFDPASGIFTGLSFDGVLLGGSNVAGGATFTTALPTNPPGIGVLIGLHQDILDTIIGYLVPPNWITSSNPKMGTIASGASQNVEVSFDALNLSPGNFMAGVVVDSNDPDQAREIIQINLTVKTPTGKQIRVAPDSINFGEVELGQTSATATVQIISVGGENLTVSDISKPSSDFTLSDLPTLPVIMPPGSMVEFRVAFVPNSTEEIHRTITITSDDADNPSVNVSLLGHGSPIVSVAEPNPSNTIPAKFVLEQNYPNPFNPVTKIRYTIPENSYVTLKVFNLLGQAVRTLVDNQQGVNTYEINWDGKNDTGVLQPSGLYIFQLKAGNNVQTRKMLFIK